MMVLILIIFGEIVIFILIHLELWAARLYGLATLVDQLPRAWLYSVFIYPLAILIVERACPDHNLGSIHTWPASSLTTHRHLLTAQLDHFLTDLTVLVFGRSARHRLYRQAIFFFPKKLGSIGHNCGSGGLHIIGYHVWIGNHCVET